ncbi:MAG: dihydrolipoamide dehydrogenase [Candidatus Lokiarchaeota archaeon]|nr:dihydrolipoamide dehydrogenase [Candidatus Lokiarchaeota archaeon]MBD3199984.1 dihydrolipoamide dehydrogenase [Candidatus Lokiarchaeota archaeon]
MKEYDFVVIGSGVGLSVLNTALNQELDCALIENDKVGGTCLTRGCIPSKVLVYPADVIREAQHAKKVGLDINIKDIDWNHISKRMWSQINEGKQIAKSLSQVDNLDLYRGKGEFSAEYEMSVFSEDNNNIRDLKAKRFLIASGSRSLIPPIKGLDKAEYVTSETFFGEKFPKKPWESLIIIGGGIIAAEFAHIFSALGTKVSIIEMLPRLVSTEEPEVSEILENNFREYMDVYLNKKAVEVNRKKGKKIVVIEDTETKNKEEIKAEEILVAAGRRSNADLLKVENTGVDTDEKGWIITNEYLETSKERIWCIGDANGKYQFRHKGNYESELVTYNIFGPEDQKRRADYSSTPWAIFTYPQIGHVGMTQQEAIDKGHKIFIAKNKYSSVAKGFAMGIHEGEKADGLVKLVVDQSYSILGASVIGPSAAILIQPFAYLMNSGYQCQVPEEAPPDVIPKSERACPEAGSFMPIYNSMIIHPSLNEVTAWSLGNLQPVNIEQKHHHQH